MKIERLIQIFEQLLPIYEKGYKEKYSRFFLYENNLEFGLCYTVFYTQEINDKNEFFSLFRNGYYSSMEKTDGYMYPKPKTWQDLKPRIDFMKSEIKDLKKLLKQGYTHV